MRSVLSLYNKENKNSLTRKTIFRYTFYNKPENDSDTSFVTNQEPIRMFQNQFGQSVTWVRLFRYLFPYRIFFSPPEYTELIKFFSSAFDHNYPLQPWITRIQYFLHFMNHSMINIVNQNCVRNMDHICNYISHITPVIPPSSPSIVQCFSHRFFVYQTVTNTLDFSLAYFDCIQPDIFLFNSKQAYVLLPQRAVIPSTLQFRVNIQQLLSINLKTVEKKRSTQSEEEKIDRSNTSG